MTNEEHPALGFLGLGEIGGPMVRNLLEAGYTVVGFDLDPERRAASVLAGARDAGRAEEVVRLSDVVLTSLPSSDAFVSVADNVLAPLARSGQVFIEMGTTVPVEMRRLSPLFQEKGAALLEAPCSGGPGGVQSRTLRLFVGGDESVFEQCRPILEALGGPSSITYCGPSGMGQVVKGVNQLAMGLGAAAYMEAVAFGVRCGLDPKVIETGVGGEDQWRDYVGFIARQAAEGKAEQIGVKFRELPYFLREAEEQGFHLPLTQLLFAFCDQGDRVVIDDHRQAPSFWRELMMRDA